MNCSSKICRAQGIINCAASAVLVSVAAVVCLSYSRTVPTTTFSLAFLLVPFCLSFAATGQLLRSATLGAVLTLVVHLLNRLKVEYFLESLKFPDIRLIGDPGNWKILLHYPAAGAALLALLLVSVWAVLAHRKTVRRGARARALLLALGLGWLTLVYIQGSNLKIRNAWLANLPRSQGTFADLVLSAGALPYVPPVFAGEDEVFLRRAAALSTGRTSSERPDIVVWLQESTVNPQIYDLPGATLPQLAMFQPDATTRAQGWLRVHTFGGATWKSEFALFSGLVSHDFGPMATSVFYSVTPHLKTSLIKVLKANGYYTVALTPFNKSAYNTASAYRDFGLDRLVQPQDLGYPANPARNLYDIESREMAAYAQKLLTTHTNQPVFVFLLSIKEHGPYAASHPPAYSLDAATSDQKLAGRLSDYFQRLQALDAATRQFSNHLMHRARPTLFLYFGDHQASLESGALHYRAGLPNPVYLTQFALQDNRAEPQAAPVGEITDLCFLGGLLLERANLKPDALFEANTKMRQLSQGCLEDCPDSALVASYKHYVYQTLHCAEK